MIAATQTRAMHSTITPATRKVVSSRLAGFQVSCLNVIVRLCDCLCVCVAGAVLYTSLGRPVFQD